MKAAAKHSAKLQAVQKRPQAGTNSNEAMEANGLIGFEAEETILAVSDVLDFVIDFNVRGSHSEMTPNIERGMTYVLEYARDALQLQAREIERQAKESANG